MKTINKRRETAGEICFLSIRPNWEGGCVRERAHVFKKKSIECRLLFETGWFVVVGCGSSSGAPFSLSVLVTRQPHRWEWGVPPMTYR